VEFPIFEFEYEFTNFTVKSSVWKFLEKSSLTSLFYDALLNYNFLIKELSFFGLGLKLKNWIHNANSKSDFDFGLSITIQYNKLDCNSDWPIQQSNSGLAMPCI